MNNFIDNFAKEIINSGLSTYGRVLKSLCKQVVIIDSLKALKTGTFLSQFLSVFGQLEKILILRKYEIPNLRLCLDKR